MIRRLLLIAGAMLLTVSTGAVARADSFTLTGINTGVTGVINITQLSNNQIGFTITNTSTGATTGKITSIGFDLPGGGAFTLQSSSNPITLFLEHRPSDLEEALKKLSKNTFNICYKCIHNYYKLL